MNRDHLNQWLGKTQSADDTISTQTAHLMQAALDRTPTLQNGDPLPPAWHWLYFHEAVPASKLGVEGHTALGQFMPPITFDGQPPRRMWAGGKIEWKRPIPLGSQATKIATIKSLTPKEGRSGKLVFVIVSHEVRVDGETCLTEEQTIVYREPRQKSDIPPSPKPAPDNADFSATYTPDPILLFRYSALTHNGHRIHYDVDFCREHEGYPNLVVHGPLIATLLLDLYSQQGKPPASFTYRAISPLFVPNSFTVNGSASGQLWAANHMGHLAMSATIS